jgi:hypothetical protein
MELLNEVLAEAFKNKAAEILCSVTDIDVEKLFEKECFQLLLRIRDILDDESLEDKACFYKIEEIVNVFEELGYYNLSRHDFG